MTANEIEAMLAAEFPNADIAVQGEGAKFEIAIVSDAFSGKRPVARQQLVYAILNAHISTGEIHAVTMNLKTTDEAA